MYYTHYIPVTGERGTKIDIPEEALLYKDQFEKAVGRPVAEFVHTEGTMTDSTYVKLEDGTDFYINDMFEPISIFVKEDGTMIQGYHEMPECAQDSDKTTRVRIEVTEGFDVLTPFASFYSSAIIIDDIASGRGVTFYDDRDQLTVIPYHNIKKATVVEAPYGG